MPKDNKPPIVPRLIIPTSFAEAMSYFQDILVLKMAVEELNERVTRLEEMQEHIDNDNQ